MGPTLAAGAPARLCIVMMSAAGGTVDGLPVVNPLKRHGPAARIRSEERGGGEG